MFSFNMHCIQMGSFFQLPSIVKSWGYSCFDKEIMWGELVYITCLENRVHEWDTCWLHVITLYLSIFTNIRIFLQILDGVIYVFIHILVLPYINIRLDTYVISYKCTADQCPHFAITYKCHLMLLSPGFWQIELQPKLLLQNYTHQSIV